MKFNVFVASNGLEAIDIIQNHPDTFSLVLTDYNMPYMDGMELVINLRQLYQKDALGIIVLSSEQDKDIASKFIKIGANDFINKPFTKLQITTRINLNLEILELFKKTKDMANKDFLTGIYNRRYFFEVGTMIFEKAKRNHTNLCIAA
jgi:PleD family two-component response regulator